MSDIDLKINGQSVVLPRGFSITVEYYNSIFSPGRVKGDKSYPVTLPVCPENQAFFGHPENLQSAGSLQRSYPAELYAHGDLVIKGSFKLRKPSRTGYPGYLVGSAGGFSEVIEGQKINEMDMGSLSLPTTEENSVLHFLEIPERHEEIPYMEEGDTTNEVTVFFFRWYYNSSQFYVVNVKYSQSVESTLRALAGLINITSGMPKALANGRTLTIIYGNLPGPPPLIRINTKYLSATGHLREVEYVGNLSRLVIQSIGTSLDTTVTNGVAGAVVFPMIHNPKFYPDDNANYSKYVNFYQNGKYLANESLLNRTRFTVVPMPFLMYVLQQIAQWTGYRFFGAFLDNPTLQELIFYSIRSLDRQPEGYTGEPFISYAPEINYARQLPEMTIGECLNELRKLFGVELFFSDEYPEVEFVLLRDIINDLCRDDWSAYAVPDWSRDQDDPKGYTYGSALDPADELSRPDPETGELPGQLKPYVTGDGKEKLESKIGTLITGQQDPYVVPMAMQRGISPFYNLETSRFTPRLLFWHGLVNDSNSEPYPKADNVSLDGNYSLQWNGANGLFEQFHKDWHDFLQSTRVVEMPLQLNIHAIKKRNLKAKKHIQGQNYLVEKLVVQYPLNESNPAKATLWQC
jgi:hypothetical protein